MSRQSDVSKEQILRAFESLQGDLATAKQRIARLDDGMAVLKAHIVNNNWNLVKPRKSKQAKVQEAK